METGTQVAAATPNNPADITMRALGTRYLAAPTAEILMDGRKVGSVEVTQAPDNTEQEVATGQVTSSFAQYSIPTPQTVARARWKCGL